LFDENHLTNGFITSEREEAIFLADHPVILANSLASVRTVMEIDLPRPCGFKPLATGEYLQYPQQAILPLVPARCAERLPPTCPTGFSCE
jgi:NitT/TauT family transport system ATP-binding protein